MPNERERHLVVATIPARMLAPVLAGERPGQFPLAGPLAHYAEWDVVSHTFEVGDDGSAIVTAVLETRVRTRKRQQAGSSGGGAPSREERREQRKQERMRRKQERVRQKQERRSA